MTNIGGATLRGAVRMWTPHASLRHNAHGLAEPPPNPGAQVFRRPVSKEETTTRNTPARRQRSQPPSLAFPYPLPPVGGY